MFVTQYDVELEWHHNYPDKQSPLYFVGPLCYTCNMPDLLMTIMFVNQAVLFLRGSSHFAILSVACFIKHPNYRPTTHATFMSPTLWVLFSLPCAPRRTARHLLKIDEVTESFSLLQPASQVATNSMVSIDDMS